MKKGIFWAGLIVVLSLATYSFKHFDKKTTAVAYKTPGVGDMAPDINMASPEGKKIALSSLRGKLVLLDFWASWCGPCRYENPNVVAAYNEFKDKQFKSGDGFTVYSVSLDVRTDRWKNAINKDKLSWEYHVSDLKGWQSDAAALYGVEAIPTNFLIDGDGKIIATDLRGDDLTAALQALVK